MFRFVGEKEIVSLIKALPVHNSSQVEGIQISFLKDAVLISHLEMCRIINGCFHMSIMPNLWKIGTITPVPKKGLSFSVSDYRPILVLPTPGKIIERAVHNQLIYHLESCGLLDHRQHGFRQDHSTSTAVFELVQYILYDKIDNKEYVGCTYVDYSNEFDTLDHTILCKILEYCGLSGSVIEWCRQYLVDRSQCVKVDNMFSSKANVSHRVPQGSIIGPLFFIIYVNDRILQYKENDPLILLYVDDTVIYFTPPRSTPIF